MQALNTLLSYQSAVLLIAPTGWGKTTLLFDLLKNSEKTWVYLAPLRALANEFYIRASQKEKSCLLISHAYEVQNIIQSSIHFKLLVITPELMSLELMDRLPKDTHFIFDEIHLFYHWGDSFRPKLNDIYIDVYSRGFSALSLSATMEDSLLARWQNDGKKNYENSYVINLKNHTLKKEPKEASYIPKAFSKLIQNEVIYKKTSHAKLIFCQYRNQVHQLQSQIQKLGFSVVTCVGGETQFFSAKLQINPNPDFIIATSAISHGVNLPKISIVYINYPVRNYDFWVQMIGRGGRQGETFEVFSRDKYRITKLKQVRCLLKLVRLKLWAKIFPYEYRRYFNSQNSC